MAESRQIETTLAQSYEPDLGAEIQVYQSTGAREIRIVPDGELSDSDRAELQTRAEELRSQYALQQQWPSQRILLVLTRAVLWLVSQQTRKPPADSRLGADLVRLGEMVGVQAGARDGKMGIGV